MRTLTTIRNATLSMLLPASLLALGACGGDGLSASGQTRSIDLAPAIGAAAQIDRLREYDLGDLLRANDARAPRPTAQICDARTFRVSFGPEAQQPTLDAGIDLDLLTTLAPEVAVADPKLLVAQPALPEVDRFHDVLITTLETPAGRALGSRLPASATEIDLDLSVAVADLTGDGQCDLVVTVPTLDGVGQVAVFTGPVARDAAPSLVLDGSPLETLATRDVDLDGATDLVLSRAAALDVYFGVAR